MQSAPGREFTLSDSDFAHIVTRIQEASGIVLSDGKRDLVYGRLAPRLRKLGCASFAAYLRHLDEEGGADEQIRLVNSITTNLTSFFREKHHFDRLADEIIPELRRSGGVPRLRIWSAGCSSGQEPYSIGMVVKKTLVDLARWDALILATDIDSDMVAHAEAGVYDSSTAETIPAPYSSFVRPSGPQTISVDGAVKALIRFKRLNLIGPWPMSGSFDVIFCRNVVIYFDKDTQRTLFDRFADMLRPEGWLFIGHSESLHRVSDRFRHVGQTSYRKIL
jgi:chemotaxis protein methyltransferase CheR